MSADEWALRIPTWSSSPSSPSILAGSAPRVCVTISDGVAIFLVVYCYTRWRVYEQARADNWGATLSMRQILACGKCKSALCQFINIALAILYVGTLALIWKAAEIKRALVAKTQQRIQESNVCSVHMH
jgi:hypothetical protein